MKKKQFIILCIIIMLFFILPYIYKELKKKDIKSLSKIEIKELAITFQDSTGKVLYDTVKDFDKIQEYVKQIEKSEYINYNVNTKNTFWVLIIVKTINSKNEELRVFKSITDGKLISYNYSFYRNDLFYDSIQQLYEKHILLGLP